MRALVCALAAMLAAACASNASSRCDLEATRIIALTAPDAEDRVSARSIGPACDKAVGLLEVRTDEGYPVWSWSAPISHRFGDAFPAQDSEAMQAFLERWTDVTVATTDAAPAWADLQPGQTTLDELTYDDIRARALPMLCHYSGTAREACVFWEPAAGGAGHFYERDVEENEE